VRVVGYISLNVTCQCQLEFAAVRSTFALRLISLLAYPYAAQRI
jgi:hypothetical protein